MRYRIKSLICIMFILQFHIILAQTDIFHDEPSGVSYRVEVYQETQNLSAKMVFAPDGRLFYGEKDSGAVRVISTDGVLQDEPVIQFEVDNYFERGLIGLTLDSGYAENGYMWVYYISAPEGEIPTGIRLVRFQEKDGIGSDPVPFIELDLPSARMHTSANVLLGPDGYLYLSIGDMENPGNAQNLEVPFGKLNRFEVLEDRLIPAPDNPFGDSSAHVLGLRNPFDFTFDPFSGNIFVVDNGPECDDELNLLLPGFNYGWREGYACTGTRLIPEVENYVPPLLTFTPSIGISGVMVYEHPAIPEWEGNVFLADSATGQIRRVILNDNRTQVEETHEIELGVNIGAIVDIALGPEGAIYFTGFAQYPDLVSGSADKQNDGAIYRIVPTTKSS